MKKFLVILLALALVLAIGGCAAPTATPEEAAPPKILKIGIALPFSGPAAAWGIPPALALELEADRINSEGGVNVGGEKYTIEVIRADDLFTSDGAKMAAEKLIYRDRVNFIFGGVSSHDTLGVQLVTTPNKVINASTAWERICLYIDGVTVPYAFKVLPTPRETVPTIWKYIQKAHPEVKRVAIVAPNLLSSVYGSDVNEEWLERTDLEVVFREHYEYGMIDFYPILARILATEPDVIQSTDAGMSDWGLIIKQSRELGYEGLFMQEIPLCGDWLFDISGKENANGLITYDYMWYGPNANPAYKEIDSILSQGEGWISLGYSGTSWLSVLVQAIEAAGTIDDPDKIVEALETGTFYVGDLEMKFVGEEHYGRPRVLGQPLIISEIIGGEPTAVGTISVEEQLHAWD